MKLAIGSIASAIVVALTVACTPPSVAASGGSTERLSSSHSVIAAQQLGSMRGSTGFDALRLLPAYLARADRRPAPRFVAIIDGTRTSDLELLKSIPATDLFEIRIISERQTVTSRGDVEIIVTTLGGRTTSP